MPKFSCSPSITLLDLGGDADHSQDQILFIKYSFAADTIPTKK